MTYTAQDYLTIDIIDKVYDEQLTLQELMVVLLDRRVELVKVDTSKGVYTIPYPELINTIEYNIDLLSAGEYRPQGMQSTVVWQGGFADARRLSYMDVNRWFDSISKITELVYSMVYNSFITNTYYTGTNRVKQMVRTVRN